jgi:hypothetical protein
MRATSFGAWLVMALATVSGATAQEAERDIPFWLVPNAEIDLMALKPAAIVLVGHRTNGAALRSCKRARWRRW